MLSIYFLIYIYCLCQLYVRYLADQYIGNMMQTDLVSSYAAFLRQVFRDCQWPEKAIDLPIRVQWDINYMANQPLVFLHFLDPSQTRELINYQVYISWKIFHSVENSFIKKENENLLIAKIILHYLALYCRNYFLFWRGVSLNTN